jgi:hypothetical protein
VHGDLPLVTDGTQFIADWQCIKATIYPAQQGKLLWRQAQVWFVEFTKTLHQEVVMEKALFFTTQVEIFGLLTIT